MVRTPPTVLQRARWRAQSRKQNWHLRQRARQLSGARHLPLVHFAATHIIETPHPPGLHDLPTPQASRHGPVCPEMVLPA